MAMANYSASAGGGLTAGILGPAASIDLGSSPLSHRNYSNSLKGFSFRRSFDDKIIAPPYLSRSARSPDSLNFAAEFSASEPEGQSVGEFEQSADKGGDFSRLLLRFCAAPVENAKWKM